MVIFEIIFEYILEIIIFDKIVGFFSRVKHSILRLRGVETRSPQELKLSRLKKRYDSKSVKLKRKSEALEKGIRGVVLEVIDTETCFVKFEKIGNEIKKVRLKNLVIIK